MHTPKQYRGFWGEFLGGVVGGFLASLDDDDDDDED